MEMQSVAPTTPVSDLYAPDEAAGYIKSNWRTLARWRLIGTGPRYVRVGRKVFYRLRDLEAWLDQQTRHTTGDPA